jgi:hypothetical protein
MKLYPLLIGLVVLAGCAPERSTYMLGGVDFRDGRTIRVLYDRRDDTLHLDLDDDGSFDDASFSLTPFPFKP